MRLRSVVCLVVACLFIASIVGCGKPPLVGQWKTQDGNMTLDIQKKGKDWTVVVGAMGKTHEMKGIYEKDKLKVKTGLIISTLTIGANRDDLVLTMMGNEQHLVRQ